MPSYQNLIPKYVDGTLSGRELTSFVKQLETDPSLQDALATYRMEHPGDPLPNMDQPNESNDTPAKVIIGIAIAASLLFLTFSALYWHAYYNYNTNVILSKFTYDPFDQEVLDNLEKDEPDVLVLQEIIIANQQFKAKDYFSAIKGFDKLILQLDKYPVLGIDGSRYVVENMEWNRIIAYLTINNDKNSGKVKGYLSNIISQKDHRYQKKAYNLMTNINSFMYDLADSD